jgi:hypothetical protein
MQTIQKRPTLEQVMSYENPHIVGSFLKSFAVSKEEANDIFDQVKSMMWLMNEMDYDGLRSEEKAFSIDDSLVIIDEMWHTFILFTKEYDRFCRDTFGYFMHHLPAVETEETKKEYALRFEGLTQEQIVAEVMNEKRWQYVYVFKKLGQASFLKWYTEYHQKYTAEHILALRAQVISAPASAN